MSTTADPELKRFRKAREARNRHAQDRPIFCLQCNHHMVARPPVGNLYADLGCCTKCGHLHVTTEHGIRRVEEHELERIQAAKAWPAAKAHIDAIREKHEKEAHV